MTRPDLVARRRHRAHGASGDRRGDRRPHGVRALRGEPANDLVQSAADWRETCGWFTEDLFTPSDPKIAEAVNAALAALIWVIVGAACCRSWSCGWPPRRRPGSRGQAWKTCLLHRTSNRREDVISLGRAKRTVLGESRPYPACAADEAPMVPPWQRPVFAA